MRPAFLYLLFFVAIATAFVSLSPVSERRPTAIPAEALARHRASALVTRISFTSEAEPVVATRALPQLANLQEPAALEAIAPSQTVAALHSLESEGTH